MLSVKEKDDKISFLGKVLQLYRPKCFCDTAKDHGARFEHCTVLCVELQRVARLYYIVQHYAHQLYNSEDHTNLLHG